MKTQMLLICVLLVAGVAFGQIDPNDDGIGIYADVDGLTHKVDLEVGVAMEVYLLLTRPTGPQMLAGWEGKLICPDNVSVWGFNYPYDGTMALVNGPNFAAVHDRVPYQDINLLMTFIIVPLDSDCAQFYLDGADVQGDPEFPRYLDWNEAGTGSGDLYDLTPYPDGSAKACFIVNESGLPTECATLGQVKALYR